MRRISLDKICQAPKAQITAPDKQIRMAQYPAKTDIIKAGPRETPTCASGFSVSTNNLNERKTLHGAVPKELYFRTLH